MLRNKDDTTRTRLLYLGISVTRDARDATHTTREQQLAAFRIRGWFAPRRRLSRDTSTPSSLASPHHRSCFNPPTPASPHPPSPPSPFSLPLAVHASLRLVLRCRMGNAVSPPKRVSCPPSRAFQSVFCHLEVCVVTRSRLFALGVSPSGVRKGKRKRERIKKVWSSNKLIFVRYTVIRT